MERYRIIVFEKPNDCSLCPLRNSMTRNCGTIISNKQDSAGMNYRKVPNKKCKIKRL